jgi:hypothetical protein
MINVFLSASIPLPNRDPQFLATADVIAIREAIMPERPTRRTAERIQEKIRGCNVFLFLATSNSMSSRWCPWEIGYADGVKRVDSILVIPTQDGWGTVYGNEYLQLYRHLDFAPIGGIGHFGSDNRGYILKGDQQP